MVHIETERGLFDEQAERSVLSGLMLDSSKLFDVEIQATDFYLLKHQRVFESIAHLVKQNQPVDLISLGHELTQRGHLAECGGHSWLAELSMEIPSAGAVGHHVELVRELAERRRLVNLGQRIIQQSSEGMSADELRVLINQELEAVDAKTSALWVPMKTCLEQTLEHVEKIAIGGEVAQGLQSGLKALDSKLGGLKSEQLVIVAGRPSMGKTSQGAQMALSAAKTGATVGIVSLEMSKTELTRRFLAIEGQNLSVTGLTHGHISGNDWVSLSNAAESLSGLKIFILDDGRVTIESLRNRVRYLKRKHGLDLLVVDYLQLIEMSQKSGNRVNDMSEISRSLKLLAKELKIPIVALSQLNRSCESRNDKRPLLSDLRESGAIEQDADVVIFIYRDEVYDHETPDWGVAELLIRKNRNGPIGEVRVGWNGAQTRFFDLAVPTR